MRIYRSLETCPEAKYSRQSRPLTSNSRFHRRISTVRLSSIDLGIL